MGIFNSKLKRQVRGLREDVTYLNNERVRLINLINNQELTIQKQGSAMELLANTLGYVWVSTPVKKGNGAELVWRWEKKAPAVPIEDNPIMQMLFPGLGKKPEAKNVVKKGSKARAKAKKA